MKFVRILRTIASHLTVNRCLACRERIGAEDTFCPSCAKLYAEQRKWGCGICGAPLGACLCSGAFLERHGVRRMVKLFRYRPDNSELVGNRLLYRLKRHNIRVLQDFLARELAASVRDLLPLNETYAVAYVPRTKKHIGKYGFDQSAALAKALAKKLGLPFLAALRRAPRAPVQKSMASKEERYKNAAESFLPKKEMSLRGERVLLVDDVVTTGASMAACARALRRMGAREVIALSVSVVTHHPNLKYEHDKNTHLDKFFD
jgi:ComF family protein